VLSGDAAFPAYDTFGVPFDFIEDTAATNDVRVDKRRLRARHGRPTRARPGPRAHSEHRRKAPSSALTDDAALRAAGDRFEGYGATRVDDVTVLALCR
jgi:alanyl-tRNA synthetase